MRKIKLVPDKPFHNNVDVTVYDVTDGAEKKRCKITIDYAESDIDLYKKKGLGFHEVLRRYENHLYLVVKLHISDDWEYAGGKEAVMSIVEEHIIKYFQ